MFICLFTQSRRGTDWHTGNNGSATLSLNVGDTLAASVCVSTVSVGANRPLGQGVGGLPLSLQGAGRGGGAVGLVRAPRHAGQAAGRPRDAPGQLVTHHHSPGYSTDRTVISRSWL